MYASHRSPRSATSKIGINRPRCWYWACIGSIMIFIQNKIMRRWKKSINLLFVISCFCASVDAKPDPEAHKACIDARDFKGCVSAFSTGDSEVTDDLRDLLRSLKALPSRLENTNLVNFSIATQQFNDALSQISLSGYSDKKQQAFIASAKGIKAMVDAYQVFWSLRIKEGTSYGKFGNSYNCAVLKQGIDRFNRAAGPLYTANFFCNRNSYQTDAYSRIEKRINAAVIDFAELGSTTAKESIESDSEFQSFVAKTCDFARGYPDEKYRIDLCRAGMKKVGRKAMNIPANILSDCKGVADYAFCILNDGQALRW